MTSTNKSAVGARIKRIIEREKLSYAKVGAWFSISAQAVGKWTSGKSSPNQERLAELCTRLHVPVDFILTGQGRDTLVDKNTSDGLHFSHSIRALNRGRLVPRLTAIQAASGRAFHEAPKVETRFQCSASAYQIEVFDTSNLPDFKPGDVVVIDPEVQPTPGRMVLAVVNRKPVFARFTMREGIVELVHLNRDWGSHLITSKAVGEVLGSMTEHARPYRD